MADKITLTEEQQKKVEAAKAQLAANREAQAKTAEQQEATAQGKPTPTQEENDLAKLGAYIPEHEPDGSPEQIVPLPAGGGGAQSKQATAKPAGSYQTRASRPADNA